MKTSFEIVEEAIEILEKKLSKFKILLTEVCLHEVVTRKYIGHDTYYFVCKACGKIYKDLQETNHRIGE